MVQKNASVPARKPQHFLYLDGMRGIAAIFVGLLHAYEIQTHSRTDFVSAHLAVDFFFCLSGFVIAFAYGNKLGRDISKIEFLKLRFIRLEPLLLAGLLLGGFVSIVGATRGKSDFGETVIVSGLSLFMIPAGLFFGNQAFPTNRPVWSLFFEIITNIGFAYVNIRNDIVLVTCLIISAWMLIFTGWYFHDIVNIGFGTPLMFVGGFARVGFPFLAGVLVFRFGLYKDRRPIWSWAGFLALVIMLALPATNWASDLFLIILVIPAIVVAGTARANATIAPGLALLGELSYPFYLLHQPILRALDSVHAIDRFSGKHPAVSVGCALVFAAMCSLAVSRLFDIPVRRYLSARLRQSGSVR